MITDKDWEDKNDAYDVALKILSLGNTESTRSAGIGNGNRAIPQRVQPQA